MRLYRIVLAVFLTGSSLFAQTEKQRLSLSGLLDTTASCIAGEDSFSAGLEAYASLRLQAKIQDYAVFNAAFNLIAVSGSFLPPASSFVIGENYAAVLELERLSLRLSGEYSNFDAGLMRLAFGYGQVFGPSDFLNPRNPLNPNARARGILGAAFSVYPHDDAKFQIFTAAPKNPALDGNGYRFGLSFDQHWGQASVQALYVFETPRSGSAYGIHRGGLSLKADVVVGLVVDALYRFNPQDVSGIEGLSASAGFDYSFLSGELSLLFEYLYSGSSSETAFSAENPAGFSARHNLYGAVSYRFTDFTNASLAALVGIADKPSFIPLFTIEHNLYQGFTVSLSGQVPIEEAAVGIITLLGRLRF
jgi:hypothetical protein